MDYFLLERDSRLGEVGGTLSCSTALQKGYEFADQEEQVEISGEGEREYGCLLEYPVPLVSNELREILKSHHADLQMKQVRIMDTLLRQSLDYNLIQMPQIPVITQLRTSELPSRKYIYGFAIPQGKLKGQAFVELNYVRKRMIVLDIAVAEQVLREGIYGVAVRRISLEERGV